MLEQKILSGHRATRNALDRYKIAGVRKPKAVAIVPHGLLVPNLGRFGKLCRGKAMLTEVIIQKHGCRVTIPGTGVNTFDRDKNNRSGYGISMDDTPRSRLDELMIKKGITSPQLGKLTNASKQQIHKLRSGDRKMSKDWAERLCVHLGVEWPDLMGWVGELPKPPPDTGPIFRTIGARIGWTRSYRNLELDEAARRLSIPPSRLSAIESGLAELTIPEAITVALKLNIPPGFLLLGLTEELAHKMALAWEAHSEGLRSERPKRMG